MLVYFIWKGLTGSVVPSGNEQHIIITPNRLVA